MNGADRKIEAESNWPSHTSQSVSRSTDIGILGAGVSGVLMGMLFRRAGMDSFTIYEKQPDVGGTWYQNTYPGLCCDVPSHLYSYSFEPNPGWSNVYADQAEIQRYIRACAAKYRLLERTRFNTTVDTGHFDAQTGEWLLKLANGEHMRHRLLVSATGGLTAPNLPRIEGYEDYEGKYWHSGNWRHDVGLAGKRVAVVGSAASAVQVVPEVARRAAKLTVFQRSPNWIVPRGNRTYSSEEKQAFAGNNDTWRRHWRKLYRRSLLLHQVFHREDRSVDALRQLCLQPMYDAIRDPVLRASLTPNYEPGCKRILVSDDYYPALAQKHVSLIPSGIKRLSRGGVVTSDEREFEADVVIFCTGYKLGGRADGSPAVKVFGLGGRPLTDLLARRPDAYRGVSLPGFPNYFTVVGINGVVAYTSLFLSAEVNGEHIIRMTRAALKPGVKFLDVDEQATVSYSSSLQDRLQQMSWAGDCTNFYKNSKGRILSFYPGSLGEMRRSHRQDSGEHYRIVDRGMIDAIDGARYDD